MKYIFIIISLVVIMMTGCDNINSPPEINISDQVIWENETLVLDLSDYATDADGDALIFTLLTHVGTLNGHIYTYKADYDEEDSYLVQIQVTDPDGVYAASTFRIVVLHINRSPTTPVLLNPVADSVLTEAAVLFKWYSSDPDGDPLLSNILLNDTPIATNLTEFTYMFNTLKHNIEYTWGVEVTDGATTVNSAKARFSVAPEIVKLTFDYDKNLFTAPYITINGEVYKLPVVYETIKDSDLVVEIPSEQQIDGSPFINGVNTKLTFIQWDDAVTDTYRVVGTNSNTTYTLYFDEAYYLRVLPSSPQICVFTETGWYTKGTEVTIIAEDYERWRFYYWHLNDVSRYSYSRIITVTMNTPINLVAYYEYICPF